MLPLVLTVAAGLAMGLLVRASRARSEKLRDEGLMPREGAETEADVDRLLRRGYKIEAIKVYRAIHGGGLKEAKEAVEMRQRQLPPEIPNHPIG